MTAPSQRDRRIRIYAYSDADKGQTGIVKPLYIFQQEVWAQIRPISGDERTTAAQAQRTERCMFLIQRSVSVPSSGLIMIKATGTLWRVQAVLSRYEKALQQVEAFLVDDSLYPRNDETVFINATVGLTGAGELGAVTSVSTGFFAAELAGAGAAGVSAVEGIAGAAVAAGGGGDLAAAGISGVAAIALQSTGSQLSFGKETITGTAQEASAGAAASTAAITTQVTTVLAGGGSGVGTGQETFTATAQEAGGGAESAAAGITGLAAVGLASSGSAAVTAKETITGTAQEAGGGSIAASGPPANLPGQHLQASGMTVVLNTGTMSPPSTISNFGATWTTGGAKPTTISNISPSSPSTVGEWCGNLSPAPGSGLRITYATNLHGGNSPVRFTVTSWSSQTGAGRFYLACMARMATTWNYSLAGGSKMWEPHTVTSGNNHIVDLSATGTDGNTHATGNAYPYFALQGTVSGNIPGGSRSNGLPPSFLAAATVYASPANCTLLGTQAGNYNCVEYVIEPESPTGTGSNNGNLTIYVNGTSQWSSVGQNDGTAGQTGINYNSAGWSGLLSDPTFGGDVDTDRPPAGDTLDVDYFFAATG